MGNTATNVKVNNEVKTTTLYVIGPGGERMRYDEWLEMRKSEMNY